MMKTKTINVVDDTETFDKRVSEYSEKLKGFATQTHVTFTPKGILYTAVIFYKEQ